jgi:hypothetical protein
VYIPVSTDLLQNRGTDWSNAAVFLWKSMLLLWVVKSRTWKYIPTFGATLSATSRMAAARDILLFLFPGFSARHVYLLFPNVSYACHTQMEPFPWNWFHKTGKPFFHKKNAVVLNRRSHTHTHRITWEDIRRTVSSRCIPFSKQTRKVING